ncbi:MAG TPA: 3-hydroxyacyl-CoA dehydrogenase NAD-binding domain-containing protein [Desulfomonilaceae bacterium]|nr:3-hydroxyacyl-CoA dehydrogenase NAD-binding domain-containing protein [Desulfomonilaceae bacterium]
MSARTLVDKKKVGIVGAGLMGHALAQLFAARGYPVCLYDSNQSALEGAAERIRQNFNTLLDLGLAAAEDAERCLALIRQCSSLQDVATESEVIIEAVSEKLPLKQKIFAEIEEYVNSETLLCTNTSAISITEIAEPLKKRERLVGTHFWNPPHIVPCVEIIRSKYTSDEAFETAYEFMKDAGKRPVKVLKDVPGFLGNRMQHAIWREAMSLAQAGIATPEDIDAVVKFGFGLRMPFLGPLETADLAGLDLTHDVHLYLFPFLENADSPLPILERKLKEGKLGAKSGEGFHEWPPERVQEVIRKRDSILLKITKLVTG